VKLTRLFTGPDNKSHFENIEMPFKESVFGKITDSTEASSLTFGEIQNLKETPWHNPPCRQYIIMLKGSMEIEIGDGSKRIFNEGDVLLAEDTSGQGHITRAASEGLRKYLAIQLK
jgi:quercetin dioxygenase-like cupin family protein